MARDSEARKRFFLVLFISLAIDVSMTTAVEGAEQCSGSFCKGSPEGAEKYKNPNEVEKEYPSFSPETDMASETFRAIVIGATGATGREVVTKLAKKAACSQVRALVRRQVDPQTAFPGIGDDASKVTLIVADHDNLRSYIEHFKGVDVAFSCIGTSRANDEVKSQMSSEGNDEGFRHWLEKVDLGYSKSFAEVAAEAGVKHLSRVSARGANSKTEGGGFSIYGRYQGMADDAVSALAPKFSHGVTCFRPGLLNRKDLSAARPHEVEWLKKRTGLDVGLLADALLVEWDQVRQSPGSNTAKVIELPELVKLAGGDPDKYL